ncbi:hypothetical protein KC19_4G156200 [Ceratodon purpureus]|uniref:Uncharacterized protein n=1 Tax=Ceratodon purpureus TaxID=3225 RepID=A0A8T0I965_CERPU|nr:hypothetical protein KC19_4G156200 [Ceratodon purpureus]
MRDKTMMTRRRRTQTLAVSSGSLDRGSDMLRHVGGIASNYVYNWLKRPPNTHTIIITSTSTSTNEPNPMFERTNNASFVSLLIKNPSFGCTLSHFGAFGCGSCC